MDPELLYYELLEVINSKVDVLSDEADEMLAELCRKIAEDYNEPEPPPVGDVWAVSSV